MVDILHVSGGDDLVKPAGVRRNAGEAVMAALASDSCGLADLAAMCPVTDDDRRSLVLTEGWSGRWVTTWRVAGRDVACPAAGMGGFPVPDCEPVRHFTWRTGQGHRPGLQSMTGTGRLHGFESHAEQCLLLVLDFLGAHEVISQPHRMRFESATGSREHTPDFLAATGEGMWLLDVRPADRVEAADRVKFAASAEAALACGWRYGVVGGWQRHVMTTLDTLSAQRRPLHDPLGLGDELLAAAGGGPVRFADLVEGTCYPAVARAFAIHLIWHRVLAVDLAVPFGDSALVWRAQGRSGR